MMIIGLYRCRSRSLDVLSLERFQVGGCCERCRRIRPELSLLVLHARAGSCLGKGRRRVGSKGNGIQPIAR